MAAAVAAGTLRATTDPAALADVDVVDICVPTPLRKTKDPDLSYVVQAVEVTAKVLRKGQLVILESTTYPGTTDEVLKPTLEAGGLVAGVDFYLAFSPERVDPGNPDLRHPQHPEGGGRRERREHAGRAGALRHASSTPSCRSARPGSPRWSSCSRTPSGR